LNVTGGDGGPKHFGTLLAITDFSSEAHVLSAGVSFQPAAHWRFHAQGNVLKTTAEYDPPEMPSVSEEVLEAIEAGDYDFSGIWEYSNLDYEQLDLSVHGSYQVSPRVRFELGATYRDLTDNTGYVYGVESGSLWIVRGGVNLDW
jgi:hypothetical protein